MKKITETINNDDITFLKSLLGKNLEAYYCDRFTFNTVAFGIVYFTTNKGNFSLNSTLKAIDYYGTEEEVSYFHLDHNQQKRKSLLDNVEIIKHEINSKINKIILINDSTSTNLNEDNYIYCTTTGIIFEFDEGRQLGFERSELDEGICVRTGYNLIEKFTPVEELIEDIDKKYSPTCKRELIEL